MNRMNNLSQAITVMLLLVLSTHTIDGGRKKSTTEKPVFNDLEPKITSVETDWNGWNSGNSTLNWQLLIGAFNMRKFGMPKINDPVVLNTLVKIVTRYDLIAVSEITDRTEKAIKKLMEQVNSISSHPYHYVVSSRVGRTNNKEQYGLIYRPELIQVKNHFVYNEAEKDPFAREPMIAQLIIKGRELVLVSIHVKPADAVAEISALTEVQEWIEKNLKIKDVVMLGDFNADCSYVPKKAWKTIDFRNMDKFIWLIGDEVDTTVGLKTNCAYDRIVISGTYLRHAVVEKSAQAFTFDEVYGLDEKTALQISDHYPVEFAIRVSSASSSNNIPHASSALFSTETRNIPYSYPIIGAITAVWDFLVCNV